MREPETLKELIEYLEWSCERMEDDQDVVCSLSDGDGFHELLRDLKKNSRMNDQYQNYLNDLGSF